jgi:crossover junction endodeoxyribonuclease RusA
MELEARTDAAGLPDSETVLCAGPAGDHDPCESIDDPADHRGAPRPGVRGTGPIRLSLPWPPSVNRIWRSIVIRGAVRVLLSREGTQYRQAVKTALRGWTQDAGACFGRWVSVEILAYPPDRRRRDLDNILKAALDALTHAGIWADDSLVAALRIERMDPSERPRLEILIEPMQAQQQELGA